MEPRRDDGDDALSHLDEVRREHRAAMEPRRDDGDDLDLAYSDGHCDPAAMEPRRDDGDDQFLARGDGLHVAAPQWSPVVTTGTTHRQVLAALESGDRRNGAPS